MMRIFSIVLKNPDESATRRISKAYPDFYKFNDTVFLVGTKDLAETIAENVGIRGDKKLKDVSGAVFGMNATYSGYTTRSLWEWLSRTEEEM